jgi:LCP family protein required for cell wall assembly
MMESSPQRATFSRLPPELLESLTKTEEGKPKGTDRLIEYVLFGLFGVMVVVACMALYASYSPSFKTVPNTVEEGIRNDRVNILFIGVGGESHPGGGKDLADALILASFKPSTKQVAVISIPRDLYVKIGRYGKHRLNKAHEIGNETAYPGGGAALTMDTASEVFGERVNAFVRLDFAAFKKIIDDLGGIDIYVQRGFYDYLFKDRFNPGWHHMNGDRALRFARYRYVIGPEGDNYARELRQQQVIDAIRARLQQRNAGDVVRLAQMLNTLSNYTDTNLTTAQIIWFYRTFREVERRNIRHVSLKPFMEKFHLKTIAEAGEAIRPRTGNYAELHALMDDIFAGTGQIGTSEHIRLSEGPIVTPVTEADAGDDDVRLILAPAAPTGDSIRKPPPPTPKASPAPSR